MKKERQKLIAPCEIAVRDVIPAIKAILVESLYNQRLSQLQIASILGISTAEVNYYLKGKRSDMNIKYLLEKDSDFMDLTESLVRKMLTSDDVINICPLCSLARKKLKKK
ncbi:transcriptional regulator [Acidianus manzaensis]|uniref:transcriptional regulator n=1 Tax=Acidianus manzaensis TaxID=282676 RepID=UPI001F28548F|nr:transcriptional regulator [Acidianus manzaensis]